VKLKDRLRSVRECGPELNGVCHGGKKNDRFIDYILRCLSLALDDSPLTWFGLMRTRKIWYAHSSKKQTERNNECDQT
jgi:hypothetical protein